MHGYFERADTLTPCSVLRFDSSMDRTTRRSQRPLNFRFKRRGQFLSKSGFALFLAAYVWYTNDELDVIHRQSA